MVISLYTVDVKLNATDKNFHKYLMLRNDDEGILLVNRGFFSISFENEELAFGSDIQFKDPKYLGDITL